jgi:hypothetical protein
VLRKIGCGSVRLGPSKPGTGRVLFVKKGLPDAVGNEQADNVIIGCSSLHTYRLISLREQKVSYDLI